MDMTSPHKPMSLHRNETDRLHLHLHGLLSNADTEHFDLLVVEHIPDAMGFLE